VRSRVVVSPAGRMPPSAARRKAAAASGASAAARALSAAAARVRAGLHEVGFAVLPLPRRAHARAAGTARTMAWVRGEVARGGPNADPIFTRVGAPGDGTRVSVRLVGPAAALAAAHPHASSAHARKRAREHVVAVVAAAYPLAPPGALAVKEPSSILSEAGGPEQEFHTDGDATTRAAVAHARRVDARDDGAPPALSVLVARGPGDSRLAVLPGSHRAVRRLAARALVARGGGGGGGGGGRGGGRGGGGGGATTGGIPLEYVVIPRNHAVVFTQDLVHAGAGYAAANLREHFFLDHAAVPRKADHTYPVTMFGEAGMRLFTAATRARLDAEADAADAAAAAAARLAKKRAAAAAASPAKKRARKT